MYLDGNRIRSLPPYFKYLQALTELYLGDNQLDSLPININALGFLKRLNLSGNALRDLPGRLTFLNLVYLDVGLNGLCFGDTAAADSAHAPLVAWLDQADRDWRASQKCQ